MNSQAPEAKTIPGKYPVSRDTIHSGCLAKPQTRSTNKRDPGCLLCRQVSGTFENWKRVPTRIHQLHPATSARAILCLVHNMLQTCNPRQNGVPPVEVETHTPHHGTGEENREGSTKQTLLRPADGVSGQEKGGEIGSCSCRLPLTEVTGRSACTSQPFA